MDDPTALISGESLIPDHRSPVSQRVRTQSEHHIGTLRKPIQTQKFVLLSQTVKQSNLDPRHQGFTVEWSQFNNREPFGVLCARKQMGNRKNTESAVVFQPVTMNIEVSVSLPSAARHSNSTDLPAKQELLCLFTNATLPVPHSRSKPASSSPAVLHLLLVCVGQHQQTSHFKCSAADFPCSHKCFWWSNN